MKDNTLAPDWTTIPAPVDDGATRHLPGKRMAAIPLPATSGDPVDLSALPGRTVVYAYPRTGRPGVEDHAGWDMIPGARGCTPQSCSFRDHFGELRGLGVDHLFGLSTQDSAYQREAAERCICPSRSSPTRISGWRGRWSCRPSRRAAWSSSSASPWWSRTG